MNQYDFIIVGGGTAGCVMASRLSANSQLSVLLIEAGPDFQPGNEPDDLKDRGVRTFLNPKYYWTGIVDRGGKSVSQARVMGGLSSLSALHHQRGFPRDYDAWSGLGIEGWGWDDVLPYFRKLESDFDFDGELHGQGGPIGVRREPESGWSRYSLALRDALVRRGVPKVADMIADYGDAVSPTPLNVAGHARSSSATGYLTRDVRGRGNLRIMAGTKVQRVIFDGKRATGIELEGGKAIPAGNVIVCTGAIHSPALLMRSGVGPAAELQEAGVPVIADRPGVGRNLINHSMITICSYLKRPARQHKFREIRSPCTMLVRYTSKALGLVSDMHLHLWERSPGPLANDPLGRQIAQSMVQIHKAFSKGSVHLNPEDPAGEPVIDTNTLGDPRDLTRLVEGFRYMCELLNDEDVAPLFEKSFVPSASLPLTADRNRQPLLADSFRGQMISIFGALAVDWIPGIKRSFLRKLGRDVNSILAEPDKLEDFVRSISVFGGHPAGTCRLGAVDDLEAVVDSRCRVIGVEGLRVVDASIFPEMMTGGTHTPAVMAGEKCADMVLQDLQ